MFYDCFFEDHATVLAGGYSEPLYLPAQDDRDVSQLKYRENYFSSALHEVAHWCIAGQDRRTLIDFGYWYEPDGRDSMQQANFEKVEIKPQALEWVFSVAACAPFQISSDNLQAGLVGDNSDFSDALYQQVQRFISDGLPARGALFTKALMARYGTDDPLDQTLYQSAFD
ncbi:MAG: elongation factor P hydroxylase [Porticoccaceae bacterium]|nr:elongation factor P hydroxylase [Porticoccaceae bacterium]